MRTLRYGFRLMPEKGISEMEKLKDIREIVSDDAVQLAAAASGVTLSEGDAGMVKSYFYYFNRRVYESEESINALGADDADYLVEVLNAVEILQNLLGKSPPPVLREIIERELDQGLALDLQLDLLKSVVGRELTVRPKRRKGATKWNNKLFIRDLKDIYDSSEKGPRASFERFYTKLSEIFTDHLFNDARQKLISPKSAVHAVKPSRKKQRSP